jgi:hypothetical protein
MAERKVVPSDEFYYQLKLTYSYLFQKHPVEWQRSCTATFAFKISLYHIHILRYPL